MPTKVLTQHNDNGRSGTNVEETILNTSNVNVDQFGKLFSRKVQGQIYAQPLYVPLVHIVGKGVHNVIIVATMDNWLYAFDADDNLGLNAERLWGRQIHSNPVPAKLYKRYDRVQNKFFDDYQDVAGPAGGNIGILGTPVIDAKIGASAADPTTGAIYLVLATWDAVLFNTQPQQSFKQLLYAINLADGLPRPTAGRQSNPVEIGGTFPGVGYAEARDSELAVDKSGGAAKLTLKIGPPNNLKTVAVTDASGGQVRFSPMQHLQRPGLLLLDGTLYIAFGSHGDFDPYHGWVFAYDAATLQRKDVFCSTPNGAKAGVWQAAEGLVADAAGNVYLGTGNGDSKTKSGGTPDLGESYIRLKASAASLDLTGWVTIFQDATNPMEDEDLGAASPTLLPDGRLVGGGKDGNFYLLDPTQMDMAGSRACVIQQFLASRGPGSRAQVFQDGKEFSTHHIHGSPVVYDSPQHGPLVYVWGENDVVRVYRYDPATHSFPGQPNQRNQPGTPVARGAVFASNDIKDRLGMPGGMLSLSANQKTPGTAILWASFPPFLNANRQVVEGELIAYNASQVDSQNRLVMLWRSHQNPSRDDYGNFAKFCCPTVANGKVYQSTFSNKLNVYGLLASADGGYNFEFGGKTGLTLNGSARSDEGPIRLTGQHLFQAGSVFCTNPVDVSHFTCTFKFRLNNAHADGLTFTIQGEGPHALGGPGGGLGYGPDPNDPLDPGYKITKSVAVKFDLFDNQAGQERSSTGLYQNGASPSGGGEIPLNPLGIDFHTSQHFKVTMSYDAATLSVTIEDEQKLVSVNQNYPVDIPAITGPMAHVGFTAADWQCHSRARYFVVELCNVTVCVPVNHIRPCSRRRPRNKRRAESARCFSQESDVGEDSFARAGDLRGNRIIFWRDSRRRHRCRTEIC